MSYRIAVASEDGIHVDVSFGRTKEFLIYQVMDDGYTLLQRRACPLEPAAHASNSVGECQQEQPCNNSFGGCQHGQGNESKVTLVEDCRVVVCKKIGFHICKQLERKAITAFDISCTITQALDKITEYYARVDGHQSLRNTAGNHRT